MKSIADIFDRLDKWRHLPAYQLERRADIFFAIYLPALLQARLGIETEALIPEFPICIGTIDVARDTNQSFKVDYLVKGSQEVVLVELKTDDASRRDKQDAYLESAQKVGLVRLLEDVWKLYGASAAKGKYRRLLAELADMGFVVLGGEAGYSVISPEYPIHIAYIQPHNPQAKPNVISFREAAEIIRGYGDALSLRFAESLDRWANTRAGER